MSDAAAPTLPQLIMEVPEPVWKKLSAVLRVETREEAVDLVQQDDKAAALASGIIQQSMSGRSALTSGAPNPKTALTSTPPAPSVGERLYGGGGKARLKIG